VVAVADMHHLAEPDAHLARGRLEHAAMRLRVADLVGEGEAVEMAREIVAFEQALEAPAGGDDRIRHDAGLVAAVQLGERLGDAGNEIGADLHLHLLVRLDDAQEIRVGELAAETLERDLEPLADGPGDVLVVPDLVEGGVGHVVGELDPLVGDRLGAVERLPEQMPALLLLAAQPLRLALGLVRIVVDDGVPQIEGDRLQLRRHAVDSLAAKKSGRDLSRAAGGSQHRPG
jgi:hypothetical protein